MGTGDVIGVNPPHTSRVHPSSWLLHHSRSHSMKTRREFLKKSGMAAAALAATSALAPAESFAGLLQPPVEIPPDDVIRALMMDAIGAAKSGGASYSDVRIGRYRNSFVFTREQQIIQTADT